MEYSEQLMKEKLEKAAAQNIYEATSAQGQVGGTLRGCGGAKRPSGNL